MRPENVEAEPATDANPADGDEDFEPDDGSVYAPSRSASASPGPQMELPFPFPQPHVIQPQQQQYQQQHQAMHYDARAAFPPPDLYTQQMPSAAGPIRDKPAPRSKSGRKNAPGALTLLCFQLLMLNSYIAGHVKRPANAFILYARLYPELFRMLTVISRYRSYACANK